MSLDVEADAFFERNPHVLDEFRRLAYKAVVAGKTRCSQRLLWERLRWELYITSDASASDYALNNNYTRRAAQRLMEEGELPEGFFQFRERHDAKAHPLTPSPNQQ